MSVSDKTKKSLENIGLTSYEIRSYTTLLKEGEINASEISEKSSVPYSKIYEVLGVLEEKGWIGSDDSRPTKYFAKSPTTAPVPINSSHLRSYFRTSTVLSKRLWISMNFQV